MFFRAIDCNQLLLTRITLNDSLLEEIIEKKNLHGTSSLVSIVDVQIITKINKMEGLVKALQPIMIQLYSK